MCFELMSCIGVITQLCCDQNQKVLNLGALKMFYCSEIYSEIKALAINDIKILIIVSFAIQLHALLLVCQYTHVPIAIVY